MPSTTWRDPQGAAVDLDSLRKADAQLFAQYHSKIEKSLRKKTRARVDVWYRVQEPGLGAKEDLLADPVLEAAWKGIHQQRVADGHDALVKTMANTLSAASLATVSSDSGVPRVEVEADLQELRALAEDPLVAMIVPSANQEAREEVPQTEAYMSVDVLIPWALANLDGSGVTVAILEGDTPDSWANLSGGPSGSCSGFACACPLGTPDDHSRLVMGVVRNAATTWGGVADDVRTISANWSHASCSMSNSVAWAFTNGASVLNRSACGPAGSPQTGIDLYLDYLASVSPYPSVVAVAGNFGRYLRSCMNLRNGVVVGGADDHGSTSRSAATMWDLSDVAGSQGINHLGSSGWEVPHIVAPAEEVDSAGFAPSAVETSGGTSLAAPQVSGAVAIAQEANSSLESWPEVILPALLVGADEDVDESYGGVWPMNLHDAFDDLDGAGLFNAWNSVAILSTNSKKNGNNPASLSGHDYGTIYLAGAPFFYSETYYASVASGAWLRAASLLQSRPQCGTPANESNCTVNPYPLHMLLVYDSSSLVAWSLNTNQNYQYAAIQNVSGSTKNYSIQIYVWDASTLSSTTFGVAWLAN